VTEVALLDGERRTLEVARMLGGTGSEAVLKHAEELLKSKSN